jgi:hypothetical protein
LWEKPGGRLRKGGKVKRDTTVIERRIGILVCTALAVFLTLTASFFAWAWLTGEMAKPGFWEKHFVRMDSTAYP